MVQHRLRIGRTFEPFTNQSMKIFATYHATRLWRGVGSFLSTAMVASALHAAAADPRQPAADLQTNPALTAEEFAKTAANSGMKEVSLAKMAKERADETNVKSFAQRIERDHSQANQKLKQIAQSKGIQLPAEKKEFDSAEHHDSDSHHSPAEAEDHQEMERLKNASGDEFACLCNTW